jgi:hypothetical protein
LALWNGDADTTSGPSAPAPPADPFADIRDPTNCPYAQTAVDGFHFWRFDPTNGFWVFFSRNPGIDYPVPVAPTDPWPTKWITVPAGAGFEPTLIRLNATPPSGVGVSEGPAAGVIGQEGTPVAIPRGGSAMLGPGAYMLALEFDIGRGGQITATGGETSIVVVPAGKTLILANPSQSTVTVKGFIAGILSETQDYGHNISYSKLPDKQPSVGNWPDSSDTFGATTTAQLLGLSRSSVTITGAWSIEKKGATWTLLWPTIAGNTGNLLTGGGDALNVLAGIAAWLVKWGPWILLGLGVVLAFWLLPQVILLLLKGIQSWQAVAQGLALLA